MKALTATFCCCLAILAACGGGSEVSRDASYFDGLDASVVNEVLDDPVAFQKIEEEPESTQPSMAQGIVRNYIVCRDAFRVYGEWTTTGSAPALKPLPRPDDPLEPSNEAVVDGYASVTNAVKSGEPQQLREWLTAEGSCGQWIPAEPGERDGPTIAAAIEATS